MLDRILEVLLEILSLIGCCGAADVQGGTTTVWQGDVHLSDVHVSDIQVVGEIQVCLDNK